MKLFGMQYFLAWPPVTTATDDLPIWGIVLRSSHVLGL